MVLLKLLVYVYPIYVHSQKINAVTFSHLLSNFCSFSPPNSQLVVFSVIQDLCIASKTSHLEPNIAAISTTSKTIVFQSAASTRNHLEIILACAAGSLNLSKTAAVSGRMNVCVF